MCYEELHVGHAYRIKKEESYANSLLEEHNFKLYGTYENPNVFTYGGRTVQRMTQADDYDYEFLYETVTLNERNGEYYLSSYYYRDSVYHSTVLRDGEIYEIDGKKYELNDMKFEENFDDDDSNEEEEEIYEHHNSNDENKYDKEQCYNIEQKSSNDLPYQRDGYDFNRYLAMRDSFADKLRPDKLTSDDTDKKDDDNKYNIIDENLIADFDNF